MKQNTAKWVCLNIWRLEVINQVIHLNVTKHDKDREALGKYRI